jgi:ATP-dependent RNA helicase DDX31/DBP7
LDHLETTKAFRIAGESIRQSADVARPKKSLEGQDSDEDFAYEDHKTSDIAGDAADGYISSDEDFESMARSRSHRTAAAAAARQSSKIVPPQDPLLALRWLVLDEADRLMDMGFEPQISSIVQLLENRLDIRKAKAVKAANRGAITHRLQGKNPEQVQIAGRRTVLCSATVEESVQKLAGIALREPLLIKGDDRGDSANSAGTAATKYAPPSQLAQKYAIVPPKLRFVTLVALLRQTLLAPSSRGMKQKILVFMSCTDAVDFAWTAFGGLKMGRTEAAGDGPKSDKECKDADGLAGKSSLLPGTPIYRLHGSLDLRTRLSSLKNFASSAADCSVLLCTSVAGRGLDVENVSCVVQYDLPTEVRALSFGRLCILLSERVGRGKRVHSQSWSYS